MNALQRIFEYQGQQVRTIIKDGEPWWVAKDICDVFGEANRNRAMQDLSEDEKGYTQMNTPGGIQRLSIVNESGLYSMLFAMRPAKARGVNDEYIADRETKLKNFRHWVTHDVLPQIRKTGSYSIPGQYYIPKTYSDALRLAADAIEENNVLRPKAEMHDLFLSAENDQPMGAVANSVGVGRNKLFRILRDKKILRYNNEPYQEFIDRKYFKVIEKPIVKGSRVENITQTFVTSKGVDYIGKLLKKEGEVG